MSDGRLPFLPLTLVTCIITVIFGELFPLVRENEYPEILQLALHSSMLTHYNKTYAKLCQSIGLF